MNLTILIGLVSIHMAAVMTPGANFLLVAQNALTYSRRSGILTVFGVATGSGLYITAGIIGFAALISQSVLAYDAIRVIGAGYFVYMGYGLLTRKPRLSNIENSDSETVEISRSQAYRNGLMTAIANPASALYFLSLFTTFIPPSSELAEKLLAGLVLVIISFGWYALVALTLNNSHIRSLYRRAEVWMNRTFGVIWLALAVKLVAG